MRGCEFGSHCLQSTHYLPHIVLVVMAIQTQAEAVLVEEVESGVVNDPATQVFSRDVE